jgi:hypothetical protein
MNLSVPCHARREGESVNQSLTSTLCGEVAYRMVDAAHSVARDVLVAFYASLSIPTGFEEVNLALPLAYAIITSITSIMTD